MNGPEYEGEGVIRVPPIIMRHFTVATCVNLNDQAQGSTYILRQPNS